MTKVALVCLSFVVTLWSQLLIHYFVKVKSNVAFIWTVLDYELYLGLVWFGSLSMFNLIVTN